MPQTVMLIHGAWMTPRSWDRFKVRYEAQGLKVTAPAWPLLHQPVEQLQHHPPPGLADLGLRQIVDHYARAIVALPEPPILIGHCFGGLFVQILLDQGLGACGVAIEPAPPFGVALSPWTFLKPILANMAWWERVRPLTLSFESFSTAFAQTLPEAERLRAYQDQIVPAPRRIFLEAMLGFGSRIDFTNVVRAPLLLMAGEKDRTATPKMVRANTRRQRQAASRTDFQLFADRSHWICNEPGWEEVADFALDWGRANGQTRLQ